MKSGGGVSICRAAERMRKDGSPGQVRVRALVQAAVQVTQAMTAAICRLWTLANAPGVVHWASQFPVGSGKGPQPATSARSSLDGTRAGVAASERPYASQTLYNTQGSSTLPPGFLSPGPKRPARMALRRQTSVPTQPLRGAPDDAPPRSAKEAQGEGELKRPLGLAPRVVQRLRELSSVSAQSLSRTGSAIAALTCDPMGAETAMQQLIDEFEVVAKSIIEVRCQTWHAGSVLTYSRRRVAVPIVLRPRPCYHLALSILFHDSTRAWP